MNRRTTGVPGLDVVLGGGVEPGAIIILAGPPGTGKTILAQQICFHNASAEHKAIYYTTLSEPNTKLVHHLDQFTFFRQDALFTEVENVHVGDTLRDEPGSMSAMVSEIVRTALDTEPSVMVIDSVKMLREIVDERDLRAAFYDLTSRIGHTNSVLFLLGEYTPDETERGPEFSLADGIIQLSYEPRVPTDRRWLRVIKMRGGKHLEGKHVFRIDANGIEVFPRLETLPNRYSAVSRDHAPSGIHGLDPLLGRGITVGDATIVLGPTGIGKTTFGLQFTAQGLRNDEKCLYVTFQDQPTQLLQTANSFGWDLEAAREAGRLVIHHVPMSDLDLDTLAAAIRAIIQDGTTRRVVISSLAELAAAAPEEARLPAYAGSLLDLIRASGASLLVTNELTTFGPSVELAGGITFLFDNIIMMRNIERDSTIGRAINIRKMRNSHHDHGLYELLIDHQGLGVGSRIDNVEGLLGWTVLRAAAASDSRSPAMESAATSR